MVAFRLEPLLKYRKLQEDILEKALAEVRLQLKIEKEKLDEFRSRQAAAIHSFQQRQRRNSLDGAGARIYSDYLARLEDDIGRQQEETEAVRLQVNRKRLELQEAAKNRKMIDKLQQQQQQRQMQNLKHRERLFFDDVATNTFIRKGGPR